MIIKFRVSAQAPCLIAAAVFLAACGSTRRPDVVLEDGGSTGDSSVSSADGSVLLDATTTPGDGSSADVATSDGTTASTAGAPTDSSPSTTTDGSLPGADSGNAAVDATSIRSDAVCTSGEEVCGGRCANTNSDSANCGGCGRPCRGNEICDNGSCRGGAAGLVISEVHNGDVTFFELYNGSNTRISLTRYQLQWATSAGGGALTLPDTTIEPGAFRVYSDRPTEGHTSLGGAGVLAFDHIAVRLLDSAGAGIDFVRTGVSEAAAPVGTAWTGANAPNPSSTFDQSLVRDLARADSDTAADWSLTNTSSPLQRCAFKACGNRCVDPGSDGANCGACGRACTGEQVCIAGSCRAGATNIWISEIRTLPPSMVEIHNPTALTRTIRGYRLQLANTSTVWAAVLPDMTLAPGQYLAVVADPGTADANTFFSGTRVAFPESFSMTLTDDGGRAIDYVQVGAVTGASPPATAPWFGATIPVSRTSYDESIRRDVTLLDTDSAADWRAASPSTAGFTCRPNLAMCAQSCVSLATDNANCGGCGRPCSATQSCVSGACVGVGAVVISEIRNSGSEWIEVTNMSNAPVDFMGWTVRVVADGGSTVLGVVPRVAPPGGAVRFTETSTLLINWSTGISVELRNAAGAGIDFVRSGETTELPRDGARWTGGSAPLPSDALPQVLSRNLFTADSDSAADFALQDAETPPEAICVSGSRVCSGICGPTHDVANCGACGNVCSIGQSCAGGTCVPFSVRLHAGGSSGRLELLHEGVWGTVCDDGFEVLEANIACRQLGFSSGTPHTAGGGTGPIFLDDLACVGTEDAFDSCPGVRWGRSDCTHGEDVGVSCVR